MNKLLLSLLAMAPLFSVGASNEFDRDKQVDLVQQVRKALLTSGVNAQQESMTIEEPARSIYHFGAVLDKHFKVIAVTPDTDAEKAGVNLGDTITAINDRAVTQEQFDATLEYLNDLPDGSRLQIQVQRNNSPLTLNTSVTRQTIPGWRLEVNDVPMNNETTADYEECGYVSVFYTSTVSLQRHALGINEIKAAGFKGGLFFEPQDQVLKVPVGEIELKVQELIRNDVIQRYRSDLQSRRNNSTKTFTLKVEPNTVYHLAAEYSMDRSKREDRKDYWQPIVWKTTERACK